MNMHNHQQNLSLLGYVASVERNQHEESEIYGEF